MRSLDKALDNVDLLIRRAAEYNDPHDFYNLLDELSGAEQMVGIVRAKALWTARLNWANIGEGSGTFEDEIFLNVGLAKATIERYVNVWDMFEGWTQRNVLGKASRDKLLSRPIADLIAISQHQNEHGALLVNQIDELADATDHKDIRKLLRAYRGEDPEEGAFSFMWRRDGTLEAWEGDQVAALGFLRKDDESLKNPLRSRAIAKLRKWLRLMED